MLLLEWQSVVQYLLLALAVPNCKVPPKKFTPELTSVPGLIPKLENVAFDVYNGLQRTFGQSEV